MSGIIINGQYKENTDYICINCGTPVWECDDTNYSWECVNCSKKFFYADVKEQSAFHFPSVSIAIFDGNKFSYMMDNIGNKKIFKNQIYAEVYLTSLGAKTEDLDNFYFIEVY